jgi:hypothetical protein
MTEIIPLTTWAWRKRAMTFADISEFIVLATEPYLVGG